MKNRCLTLSIIIQVHAGLAETGRTPAVTRNTLDSKAKYIAHIRILTQEDQISKNSYYVRAPSAWFSVKKSSMRPE